MFTDVANFTHFMSVDENNSLSFLEQKKRNLTSLIKSFNGTFVKDIGDGTLTYFKSANNALNCALELHNSLYGIHKMEIRVGIHYGKIINIKNDIYGDNVNIASRLENLSPNGGICVSGIFYNKLKNKNQIKTDYIGLQSFKGVGRLIDVYAINDSKLKKPNLEDYINENIIIDYEEVPSVTFFPLNNKGKDSDNFFAHCLFKDLTSDLSATGKIKLSSLNELESFKKRNYKLSTITKKLGSRYYLIGDLWKENKRFNLSMELFDTTDNHILWTDSWVEEWDNLDIIKNKLINTILKLLSQNYNDTEIADAIYNNNEKAYQLYLKAKYLFDQRSTDDDFEKIENLLNESMQLDSQFIEPKLLFGDYYLTKNEYDSSLNFYEAALDISLKNKNEKNIAFSLNGIGKNYYLNGKFEKALEHYEKALQIWKKSKNYLGISDTLNLIGSIHDYNGRHQKALEYYKKSYQGYLKTNDKSGMCKASFNIANSYCTVDNINKSLEFQEISFKLSKSINNTVMQGYNYNLRGIIYSNSYKAQEAYALFKKSLKIRKDLGDQEGIATLYRNIGVVYMIMGLLKQAINYFNRSLLICENIGYYLGILDCYENLGKTYRMMGIYDKSVEYYNKSLEIVDTTEDDVKKSRIMNQIGNLNIKMSNYNIALNHFEQSKKIKEKIDDQLGIGFSKFGEAKVFYFQGEYSKSENILKQCIAIGSKFNKSILVGDVNYYLSQIQLNKNKFNQAMTYINSAIKIASDNKHTLKSRLAKYSDCKGMIYKFKGDFEKAMDMHEKAFSISKVINDKHGLRKYLNNKGLIFEELSDFEKAINIYKECLSIAIEMDEKRAICVSHCNIGCVLEYQGSWDESFKYFKRAYQLAKKIGYKAGVGGYGNNLSQILIKKEDYRKAIPILKSSLKLLQELEAIDCTSCLIARAYCYIKIGKNKLAIKDIDVINSLLHQFPEFDQYKSFWQLSEIYKALNKQKKAKIYLNKSHKSLLKKLDLIKDSQIKNLFLNTPDATLIKNSIIDKKF